MNPGKDAEHATIDPTSNKQITIDLTTKASDDTSNSQKPRTNATKQPTNDTTQHAEENQKTVIEDSGRTGATRTTNDNEQDIDPQNKTTVETANNKQQQTSNKKQQPTGSDTWVYKPTESEEDLIGEGENEPLLNNEEQDPQHTYPPADEEQTNPAASPSGRISRNSIFILVGMFVTVKTLFVFVIVLCRAELDGSKQCT